MKTVISSISIKNFKSLKDTGILELKPITLLVGPNSSGKTALLQSILILKQTLESYDRRTPLILRGRYVDLGSFYDVIYNKDIKNDIEISLSSRYEDYPYLIKFSIGYNEANKSLVQRYIEYSFIEYSFMREDGSEKENIRFENGKIYLNNKEYEYTLDLENYKKNFLYPIILLSSKNIYIKELEKVAKSLREFSLILRELSLIDNDIARRIIVLSLLSNNLYYFLTSKTYYIGPLREYPKRYYIVYGEHISDVGLKGEHTIEFIYYKSKGEESKYEKVMEWIKRLGLGLEIKIKQIEENMYSLLVTDPNTKLSVNITDVGFGISQLLPIIVEGIYADKGSILLIEHPEIHLHPKAQAELMDLFIDIAKDDKQLIVETHSDHLIFRLQRRIAEGELSCDDVVIYSFETTGEGTKITKVKLNEDGTIEDWPKGFFEIEVEETKSFLNALAERRKNEEEERRNEVPSS
jgi:predicted ATPase